MDVNQAIIKRVNELCITLNRAINDLCLKGGLTPSTYYEIVRGRTKSFTVTTVKRICQGAGISLAEFFDRDYFNDYLD